MTVLTGWQNFYVIIGSSAGALIGLQFVVMALLADVPRVRLQAQAGQAFATPNVVHFGVVLLLSAILAAPWHDLVPVILIWGVLGLCGVLYSSIVIRRLRAQSAYQPVFEDWLFHAMLPFVGYATLAASSYAARAHASDALFGVAAAALLLLFIGIHNAWDTATYHVFVARANREKAETEVD